MDFCRNVMVSAGEFKHHQDQLGASIDDLFPAQNTEVDVSLEWLSVFVEDCLSSSSNCFPVITTTAAAAAAQKPINQKPASSNLHNFVIPSKARTKRTRRATTIAKNKHNPLINWSSHLYPLNKNLNFATAATITAATTAVAKNKHSPLTNWSSNLNPLNKNLNFASSDQYPPLLQLAYWLADSELIVAKREVEEEEKPEIVAAPTTVEGGGGPPRQQGRRCRHCLAQRTPQWRTGPMGPKTLCNACGVRYKSGRLLPEYRPAKSPTFVSFLHSNSHKKVMEMRNLTF